MLQVVEGCKKYNAWLKQRFKLRAESNFMKKVVQLKVGCRCKPSNQGRLRKQPNALVKVNRGFYRMC